MIDPKTIIDKYYPPGEPLSVLLWEHGGRVRDKALVVAKRIGEPGLDLAFIAEAALLHDIGIFQTDAPRIHCRGEKPYVCHGIIGREILEGHALPRHALVCERHVGTGLTVEEIEQRRLPLPLRDMTPQSLEEIIICYADKFFSKSNGNRELSLEEVLQQVRRYGPQKVEIFMAWHRRFGA
ncbi:MAG: HD domain-containing protein [Desulfobacteraceae bacterium]|nr:HD domain-containing protein [Desulfobacteraceae bacterium]